MSARTKATLTVLVLLALALALGGGGGGSILSPKVDAVTYVHEQRSGTITPAIRAALSTLNDKDVNATEFDVDTVTKVGGLVPKQYVVPLEAAKKAGGPPAAVSTAKGRLVKTIKDPTDKDILSLAP